MNQDEEHLRLLSIFHYVCAGLAAMFACVPIVHLIVGLFILLHPLTFAPPNVQPHPERFVGLLFVAVAVAIISLGWGFAACVAYAGRCLGRRNHYTFCLIMDNGRSGMYVHALRDNPWRVQHYRVGAAIG